MTRASVSFGLSALVLVPVVFLACRASREQPPAPRPGEIEAETAELPADEVVYELEGGIAGFQIELRIDRGGAAVVRDAGRGERRGQLGADDRADLARLVAAADLDHLAPAYGRPGAVVDGMAEVVAVRRGDRSVRVSAVTDPANEPPAALRDLFTRLRGIALTLPAVP
jgi:hypothetical protein